MNNHTVNFCITHAFVTTTVSALFIILTATTATAQTFEELEKALFEHPSLAAIRSSAIANREFSISARGLPDPVFSVGINNVPVTDFAFDRFLPTHKAIGVRQAIPNGRVRQAQSVQAERRGAVGDLFAAWQFSSLRADLITVLAEKNSLFARLKLTRLQDEKYIELSDVIAGEIEAGQPVVFRNAEIDVERADVASRISELEGAIARANARIVELVGIAADTVPPDQALLVWSGDPSSFYAAQLAGRGVSVADAKVAEARAGFGPDWALSLTYQQREAGDGSSGSSFSGDDWVSAGISFSVPLWSAQNQTPKLRAATAEQSAAKSAYAASARSAKAEWNSLRASITANKHIIIVLEEKIAAIDAKTAFLKTNYESGIGTYTPVIDSEIAILKLETQLEIERARLIGLIARANSLLVTS